MQLSWSIQYLNIASIAREIRDIRHSTTTEGHINGIWNAILNWVFDPNNGYVTRPQEMHTAHGGQKGFSDFHTFEHVAGNRRFFLVTQCKSPEWGDAIWESGREQLDRYLSMQHGNRPTNARTPVYGILAVGRWARFFRYHDPSQSCEDWRPWSGWPKKHEGRRCYDILQDDQLVQDALRVILNNH